MAKQPATTKTNAKPAQSEVMAAPATDTAQAVALAPETAHAEVMAAPATDTAQAVALAPETAHTELMAAPATDTAQAVALAPETAHTELMAAPATVAPTIDAAAFAQVLAQQAQMLAQMQALQSELTASKQSESLALQLLQQQTMAQHSTPAQTGLAGGPQFTSARKKAAPLMGLQGVPAIPGLAPKVRNSDVVRAWILQAMQQNSPSVDWIVEKAVKELGMSAALAKRYISENWPKVYAQFTAQGGKIGEVAQQATPQQAAPTDSAGSVE